MAEVISLSGFRSRISITELALANGYTPNKKHWCRKYPVLDHGPTGDRIYIINPAKPANQGYVNVHDDFDKGTLVDFVRKRLSTLFKTFDQPGRSEFSNINAVLYHHLSLPEPRRQHLLENLQSIPTAAKAAADTMAFREELLDMKPLQYTYFLENRGISPTTLKHPNFKGSLYNVGNHNFVNTAFPYYDHTGTTLIGLELRNHNFKQHAEHSNKSVGIWHSNPHERVDQVLITESGLDALSYHQLHRPEHTLYISVGGSLSTGQIRTIQTYTTSLEGGKEARLLLGFDQDRDGAKYDLRFLLEYNNDKLPGAFVRRANPFLNLQVPLLHKETEKDMQGILRSLEGYNETCREQMKGEEDTELKKDIAAMMFRHKMEQGILSIDIPNTYQGVSFFNEGLIKSLGICNKFGLEKAQGKDFNEDLKRTVKGGEQQKPVYQRRM